MGDDAALIAAIGQGSDLAFSRLLDRHQQAVRTFLRGVAAGGAEDADDLAQETFLSVWKHAGSFRGGAVRSWLFSIAWRKATDSRRRWSRGRGRDEAWQDMADASLDEPAGAEDLLALRQALATLGQDQKAAVMLCLGCGLTHEEAAEALALPLGTVKSHVLRGRERLRGFFGDEP